MKSTIATTVLVIALLSLGCSTVTVRQPLGERVPPAELKQWEGTWTTHDRQAIDVRVTSDGQLAFAGLEWDEKAQQFKMESARIVLTRAGDLMFAHFATAAKAPKDGYTFALWKTQNDDTVDFYLPVVPLFEQAVTDHRLKGTIRREERSIDVMLESSAENILEFITKTGVDKCFVEDQKLTYQRLQKSE